MSHKNKKRKINERLNNSPDTDYDRDHYNFKVRNDKDINKKYAMSALYDTAGDPLYMIRGNHTEIRLIERALRERVPLRGLRPDNDTDLSFSLFHDCDIRNADMRNLLLSHSTFQQASAEEAHFDKSIMKNAKIDASNMEYAFFEHCNMTQSVCDSSNLRYAHLTGADLTEARFRGVNLTVATLSKTVCHHTAFIYCNMESASFRDAMINNADFRHSDLWNAGFKNAAISNTDFRHANLDGADFTNSLVMGCDFRHSGGFEHVNLNGTVLRGNDFRGIVIDDDDEPLSDRHPIFRDATSMKDNRF